MGIFFGALPGITGTITLAILIPFAVKTNPINALALLLGAHVAVEFGGSISAILINTPGTGQAVATCFDGYPMARKGQAARAISISATSSAIGGLIGFAVLVAALPVMRSLVMALSAPEYFIMAFVGLTFIALLGEKSVVKGLIAGGLGLMTAMVGLDPVTSTPRYTFHWLYLWDGIDLIAVVVGFFAFAEMIELVRKGTASSIAETVDVKPSLVQVWQGIKDTFRYWKTLLQCSALGVILGIVPGLGGTVANVMAYGLAKRVSKDTHDFGQGAPEGVLAPESANNSKEGGALIPTLAFGIPGSAAMAIFLSVFIMMGIVPGPEMVTKNLDITFALAWVLALANVLATLIGLGMAAGLARFTFVPTRYLVPIVLGLGTVGANVSSDNIGGVVVAVVFAFLGYAFKRFDYPKAPFIVGLVLGTVVERYLHLAVRLYSPLFFLRPISLGIIIATLAFFAWQVWRNRREAHSREVTQA
ncbi:MAG: tripartite tricarboxylate transporter permease [Clostridia bacterium]|nr:tripartite tricarboxylate transporter permease [Clostridia bacterium]